MIRLQFGFCLVFSLATPYSVMAQDLTSPLPLPIEVDLSGADQERNAIDKEWFSNDDAIVLDKYGWFDAVSLGLRGAIDPDVFAKIKLVSVVDVSEAVANGRSDAIWAAMHSAAESNIEGAIETDLHVATGFGLAISAESSTEKNSYLVDEVFCNGTSCRTSNGAALAKFQDITAGALIVKKQRKSLEEFGGVTYKVDSDFGIRFDF